MICIEQKTNQATYIWTDGGCKVPVELAKLEPVIKQRLHSLQTQQIGTRIDGCGARLMSNVFIIYEDGD